MLALSALFGEAWNLPSRTDTWVAFTYVVTVGSVILFILVLFVLNRWTASATSYSFVMFPVVATLLGSWLAGERIRAGVLMGGVVVVAAVYFGAISTPQGSSIESPAEN